LTSKERLIWTAFKSWSSDTFLRMFKILYEEKSQEMMNYIMWENEYR